MSNPEGAFGVFKGAIERSSRDLVESEGPQGDNGVKLVSRFAPGHWTLRRGNWILLEPEAPVFSPRTRFLAGRIP